MDFEEEEIPRGYKFDPSELQLIEYYLTPKLIGQNMDFCSWFVFDKDLYDGYSNPMVLFHEINRNYDTKYFCDDREKGDQIRYFFTPIYRVSKTGKNIRRTTRDGKWDGDSSEEIKLTGTKTPIGIKRNLKFKWDKGVDSEYARRGKQSSWIMHEFSLPQSFYDSRQMKEKYVLCRIRRKGGALADDQLLLPPLMEDAEVPRKRQRMIPVEEPAAAIKDGSSLPLQDVLLSTDVNHVFGSYTDLLLSNNDDVQQEEDNDDWINQFAGSIKAYLTESNDEEVMISELGEDITAAEAMNTCVPIPASTTMSSPSQEDAEPTEQPCYVNRPYSMSCAAIMSPAEVIQQPSCVSEFMGTEVAPLFSDAESSAAWVPSPPPATKTIDPCLPLPTMLSPLMLDLEECFFSFDDCLVPPVVPAAAEDNLNTTTPQDNYSVVEELVATTNGASSLGLQDAMLPTNQQDDLSGFNFTGELDVPLEADLKQSSDNVQQKEDTIGR